MSIKIGELFNVSKTEDYFLEVEYNYDNGYWNGALPIKLRYQGFDYNENYKNYKDYASKFYDILNPKNRPMWIEYSNNYWLSNLHRKFDDDQTYAVLHALYSGEWECRVCGPVPKVNPQSSARLRDLKKFGYTICTKKLFCEKCNKKTSHDLLVMIPIFNISAVTERYHISKKLENRIKSVLYNTEAAFDYKRPAKELIIDHKFPSQRWENGETPNSDDMTDDEIKHKFQLLSNQTNLWKSRICDECVKTGIRGDFMGIRWYYEGDMYWRGSSKFDEKGCIGCPWYDLNRWKKELSQSVNK